MRIAFLVGETFPSISKTFIINQITGLIDRGHQVDIYANFLDTKEPIHEDAIKYQLKQRTYYGQVPQNKFSRLLKTPKILMTHFGQHSQVIWHSLNIKKYGRQALSLVLLHQAIPFLKQKTYDIVHCHFGFEGVKSVFLRDLGLLKGKLIVTFHGGDMTKYLQEEGDRVYQKLFEQGDLFLPISNHWRQKLLDLGCPAAKIGVHHMGIDSTSFSLVSRQKCDRLSLVSVCRLTEKKGIEYAIRAVAELVNQGYKVKYQIIGDGVLKSALEQLSSSLNLENSVIFLGSQPKSKVIEALNQSDILLAPSITATNGDCEGIPVALMEAMATGLPVISTWHSGIPELVQDGISGYLVAEKDVVGLAAKIAYLQEHPELRSQFGIAGAKKVREHYNIQLLNDHLVEMYQELVNVRALTPTSDLPMISVIIPVFNDGEKLHQCLTALENQTYPSELYEVIVIDNGSEQNINREVEKYPHAIANIELVPGSYVARNRGIALAKGTVLAFTDADCIPQPHWLISGVQTLLSNSQYGIVGGKVALFYQNSDPSTPVEMYESLHAFPQSKNISQDRFSVTANLFTYKHIFQEIGKFNPQLKSNGDREWCNRVFAQGYQLAYAANAIVKHPARHSLAEIYHKNLRIIGGQEQVELLKFKQIKPKSWLKALNTFNLDLILGFLPPLKYCWRIFSLKNKYSLINKIQIITVLVVLKYGGQWEKIKIRMGSLAHR